MFNLIPSRTFTQLIQILLGQYLSLAVKTNHYEHICQVWNPRHDSAYV